MKYCQHCGQQLADDARFCTNCGQPVAAAPASEQSSSQRQATSTQVSVFERVNTPDSSVHATRASQFNGRPTASSAHQGISMGETASGYGEFFVNSLKGNPLNEGVAPQYGLISLGLLLVITFFFTYDRTLFFMYLSGIIVSCLIAKYAIKVAVPLTSVAGKLGQMFTGQIILQILIKILADRPVAVGILGMLIAVNLSVVTINFLLWALRNRTYASKMDRFYEMLLWFTLIALSFMMAGAVFAN